MPVGFTPPPSGNDWGAFAAAQPGTPIPQNLELGPYARFVPIVGPPNGVALEILDTDTNTWIEQWRYTE